MILYNDTCYYTEDLAQSIKTLVLEKEIITYIICQWNYYIQILNGEWLNKTDHKDYEHYLAKKILVYINYLD